MTTKHCDKYGFKGLPVGGFKYVTGRTITHASSCYYRYCERHPEMIHKDFKWERVAGGIKITRIR